GARRRGQTDGDGGSRSTDEGFCDHEQLRSLFVHREYNCNSYHGRLDLRLSVGALRSCWSRPHVALKGLSAAVSRSGRETGGASVSRVGCAVSSGGTRKSTPIWTHWRLGHVHLLFILWC